MAERDQRGRPLVSPRPKSKEEGQLEAQENQAVYDMYLNAGLNKDPISLLGLAPNMFRDTGNDNPLDAYYIAESPDLRREDTMYFSSTNKGSKDAIAHESRHRGFARIKDLYDADPEGFTEKYGEAAAVILRSDSEVQNELFDNPNAQITPDVSMRDTFTEVNPDFVAHQKKTGSFIGGESDFTMKNERLQAGVLGLQRAALDLLDREDRMPLDEGDKGGPKTRPNNSRPVEDKGFFGGIKKALGFAEGGLAMDKQMKVLMSEGGLSDDNQNIDPVSGNEVPAGSMASEVRDDIDARLSEGEYVVPADVVRYFGVKFFEDLRSKAKEDLSGMEAEGRIGGSMEPEMGETEDHEAGESGEMEASESGLAPADLEKLKAIVGGAQEPVMAAEGALIAKASEMDVAGDTEQLIDRIINVVNKDPRLQDILRKKGVAMATGGLVTEDTIMNALKSVPAFAEGGDVQPAQSNFDFSKYGLGFSSFSMPDVNPTNFGDIEMVTYVNADGYKIQIRTINGVPIDPVPAGYMPESQQQTAQQPATTGGGDSSPFPQTAPTAGGEGISLPFGGDFDPYSMTPDELLKSVQSTAKWGKSASLLGGALGPAGMLVSGIASAAGKGRMIALGNVAQTLAEEARANGDEATASKYLEVADSVKGVSGIGADFAAEKYTTKWTEGRGKAQPKDATKEAIPTGGSDFTPPPSATPAPKETKPTTTTTAPAATPKPVSRGTREDAEKFAKEKGIRMGTATGRATGGLVMKPKK